MEPSPIAETGVGAPANDTTAISTLAVICFPTLNGLPYFLVMRHLLEVCPKQSDNAIIPVKCVHHPDGLKANRESISRSDFDEEIFNCIKHPTYLSSLWQ
jgi:hypothetical protein